jgi:excisionase family DNA binding protein
MMPNLPYGKGSRMLTLVELCKWLNITERHARKLVERNAIPYRKVGHLLRFPEAEVEDWCRPTPKPVRVGLLVRLLMRNIRTAEDAAAQFSRSRSLNERP